MRGVCGVCVCVCVCVCVFSPWGQMPGIMYDSYMERILSLKLMLLGCTTTGYLCGGKIVSRFAMAGKKALSSGDV